MKLIQPSYQLLKSTIQEVLTTLKNEEQLYTTDIFLQADPQTGAFTIFDDTDTILAQSVIEDWKNYSPDSFSHKVEMQLKNELRRLKENGALDNLTISTPFSFVLIDMDKETIAELLQIDEDQLLLDEGLLNGLDDELNAFLKELMS